MGFLYVFKLLWMMIVATLRAQWTDAAKSKQWQWCRKFTTLDLSFSSYFKQMIEVYKILVKACITSTLCFLFLSIHSYGKWVTIKNCKNIEINLENCYFKFDWISNTALWKKYSIYKMIAPSLRGVREVLTILEWNVITCLINVPKGHFRPVDSFRENGQKLVFEN